MKIIEALLNKIRTDHNYKFSEEIDFQETVLILSERLLQISRGIIYSLINRQFSLFFKGSNVKIRHGHKFKVGSYSIIEDNVFINAFSIKGILLHDHVTIGRNCTLIGTGVIRNKGVGIEINENSAIGAYSILAGQGGIIIGKDVIMGPNVKIFSENHNYNLANIPIRLQGEHRSGVIINDNCWIGSGCIILNGVTLAEGTVVGAGSVITKSVLEKNCLIAGVPAKKIKSRIS